MPRSIHGLRFLRRDVRGSVAMITLLATLPLFLFAGAAIDFARQVQTYRALQNATDEATLAGATLLSESNYAADIPPLVKAYLAAATAGLNAKVSTTPTITVTPTSVTVTVWLPAVFKVALNVPLPLVRVLLAGRLAAPSLLLKWTVPK